MKSVCIALLVAPVFRQHLIPCAKKTEYMKTSRGAKARDVLRLFYFVCRHLFCSLFSKLRLCSVRGRNRPWLVSWIISLSRSAHPTIFWPYYYELDLFNNFITESIANAFHCVFVCSFSGCFHFVYYLTWEIVSLLFYVSSFTFVESSIISSITFVLLHLCKVQSSANHFLAIPILVFKYPAVMIVFVHKRPDTLRHRMRSEFKFCFFTAEPHC